MSLGKLIGAYIVLALAPLALAFAFGDALPKPLRMLGIAFGMIGFAMLLLQFVTSGRFEIFSRKVGIHRTMRFHQLTARALLLLLIAHPLLIFMPGSLSGVPIAAQMFVRVLGSEWMRSGVIALVLLLVVVVTSIWRHKLPVRYETWRASHVLLVPVIAIAASHHVHSTGTFSQLASLRAYWWLMLAAALGALGWSYLIKPWLLARRAYRVVSVHDLAEGVHELSLQPAGRRAINFVAGQFAWVNFHKLPFPLFDNPFSISSSPDELPGLRFLIKARGDATARIGALQPGSTVYLDAPHGNFTVQGRRADGICLIAGGIGITPVISILRDLAHKRDWHPVSVLFTARNPELLFYADEISALKNRLKLHVHYSVDEPPAHWSGGVGAITAEAIDRYLPAVPARCLCLICGPTPMVLAAERHLRALGVARRNIVYERFEYD